MSPSAGLARVLRLVRDARPPATVVVDGPSGSGKSIFADSLIDRWPTAQLVRLDAFYPGWSGLDAASVVVVDDILQPRAAGAPGGWRGWDWGEGRPTEWHELDPARALIVEGCGALSRRAVPFVDVAVWVSAPDALRKRRALARDDGGFDAHWEMWNAQWHRYEAREHPSAVASVLIDGTQPAARDRGRR